MFDFLIRKPVITQAQRFIDRLKPKVHIHVPEDLPLPSVAVIKKLSVTVAKINALEDGIKRLSDEQLQSKTNEFREKIKEVLQGKRQELKKSEEAHKRAASSDEKEQLILRMTEAQEAFRIEKEKILKDILPEAFAVVREVAQRTIGLRHFDIQLVGGMFLHEGKIAEMATGEGKTLVATLPAYLNALTGEGVHVITVNDYLAKRDREWMGPIYEFLGLTIGVIQHDMDSHSRKQAYNSDITYGTNNEFGFDYLRDNMVNFEEDMVQRRYCFSIVDEVDSILVDEARTPLIISGPAEESTDKYYKANDIAIQLKGRRITEREEIDAKYKNEDLSEGFDYIADEKTHAVSLTEQGEEKVSKLFGIDNLHEMETIEYRHHILQALKAKEFFRIDVEYVIREGKVIIVDEFTGRLMPGRRWSDGLHQAVEAKEGIKIERENQTLATITFQNYFRMYQKLSGMTGTAYTEANEFKQIYNLDCVVMPTNKILRRTNHPDCIYKTVKEKFNAVVEEIVELHKKGQPVLVGTISIERSEYLSSLLKIKGVPHQVLNAKYHDLEAHIIAQAGRYKAVTIATNMAGRGTDIMLGGNAEYLAKSLAEQKSKKLKGEEDTEDLTKKFLDQFKKQVGEEHEKVIEVGGLHVLGTERHESRRIDNQLRGRSGRQGDPGSSRFYVALEDDLMRLFASDRMVSLMDKFGMEEGQVIEHPLVSRALEVAQKRVETHNFEIRKQLLEYDDVMNKQREAIYSLRRSILKTDNVKNHILDALNDLIFSLVDQYLSVNSEQSDCDVDNLTVYLKAKFGFELKKSKEELKGMDHDQIKDLILQGLFELYETKEKDMGAEQLRHLEKFLFLHTIDAKWKDHLYAMDQLKEGVGLRSFAQRDPLIEYKREGFEMFQMMFESINQEIAETIFRISPVEKQKKLKGVFSSLPQQFVHRDFSSLSNRDVPQSSSISEENMGPEEHSSIKPYQKSYSKVGRNDPCPCGSGKKHKKCCGR